MRRILRMFWHFHRFVVTRLCKNVKAPSRKTRHARADAAERSLPAPESARLRAVAFLPVPLRKSASSRLSPTEGHLCQSIEIPDRQFELPERPRRRLLPRQYERFFAASVLRATTANQQHYRHRRKSVDLWRQWSSESTLLRPWLHQPAFATRNLDTRCDE